MAALTNSEDTVEMVLIMISYQGLHYLLFQPIFTAKNSKKFEILSSDQSKYLRRLIQVGTCICFKRKLNPVCGSAQSDQSLSFSHVETSGTW